MPSFKWGPKGPGRVRRVPGTPYLTLDAGLWPGQFPTTARLARGASRAGSLQGLLPGAPTDPDVHVKRIRFVAMWNRCPSHDWVVSR